MPEEPHPSSSGRLRSGGLPSWSLHCPRGKPRQSTPYGDTCTLTPTRTPHTAHLQVTWNPHTHLSVVPYWPLALSLLKQPNPPGWTLTTFTPNTTQAFYPVYTHTHTHPLPSPPHNAQSAHLQVLPCPWTLSLEPDVDRL